MFLKRFQVYLFRSKNKPDTFYIRTPFTYAFAKAGQHERALEEVESVEQMVHKTTGPHGIVFAVLGMRDRAVATLTDEALQEFSPIRMAELAAALDGKRWR